MSLSDFSENKVGEVFFRNTAYTGPATVYASLHTADPGDTGANEATGGTGPYARQAVTFAAWSSGLGDNTGAINWTGMPAATIVAVGLWDASTAGNHLGNDWIGTAAVGWKPFVVSAADFASDLVSAPAHGLAADDRIVFSVEFGGTIPTGITAGTVYFVLASGLVTDQFKISTTSGGSAVDITAAGSGMWKKVIPKVTQSGDTVTINIGDLDVVLR